MVNTTPFMRTALAGLTSAAFALVNFLPLPGLIIFSYFSALPLFLIGLAAGMPSFYGASLSATLLVFLGGGALAAGEFFLVSVFFSGILISRALLNRQTSTGKPSWYPSSLLLRDFTLICLFICFLGCLLYIYLLHGRDVQLVLQPFFEKLDPEGQLQVSLPLLIKNLAVLPGIFAFSWGVMTLLNGAIAQGILVRYQRNMRPSLSLKSLTIPFGFMIAFGLCLLISVVGGGGVDVFGKSGACVLALPFFLIGLGMIHQWVALTSRSTLLLTLFYVFLAFLFWPTMLVILLGLLRPLLEKFLPA